MRCTALRVIIAAFALGSIPATLAQETGEAEKARSPNSSSSIETVRVTARQRPEDSMDVPFALTVLDAAALENRRIDDSNNCGIYPLNEG
jgi:outer membrane receptor protein involved in Fe transport